MFYKVLSFSLEIKISIIRIKKATDIKISAILKIKLSHDTVAQILENSVLSHNKKSKGKTRIQWDPARNLFMPTTNKDSDKENNLVEPAKLSAIKVKDEELLKHLKSSLLQ